MTANEIAHFATAAEYEVGGDGWLNVLAVTGRPAPPVSKALLKPLEALLDFARIKARISPDDESLLTILQDPAAATTTQREPALHADAMGSRRRSRTSLAHFDGNASRI